MIPSFDQKSASDFRSASPIVQTSDNKQWIDLDYLSPKLIHELRRQYDPSLKDEPNGTFAKHAAKIKAWARQSKRGIDFRLRRKINATQDEVTDFRLVQEPLNADDEHAGWISELPGAQNEISEMPDTSVPQELAVTVRSPSIRSTGTTSTEPLPRYEPRPSAASIVHIEAANQDSDHDQEDVPSTRHRRSFSASSIVATPKRGLSLRRSGSNAHADEPVPTTLEARARGPVDEVQTETLKSRDTDLQADLDEANRRLDEERLARERFETLLQDVKAELSRHREVNTKEPGNAGARPIFEGLKLAESARYETETDAEPPSPSDWRNKPAVRGKKKVTQPKRRTSGPKTPSSPLTARKRRPETVLESNVQPKQLVERQATVPRRLPVDAGPETVWSALLQSQATIIGPEHHLVYQAKSDLARSRANQHCRGQSDILEALHESRRLAIGLLGAVHPRVAAFSADMKTLHELIGKPYDSRDSNRGSPLEATGPASFDAPDEQQPEDQDPTLLDSSLEAEDNGLLQSAPSLATGDSQPQSVVTPNTRLPLITTTSHETDAISSAGLWNTYNPPHQPRNDIFTLLGPLFAAMLRSAQHGIAWVERNYGLPPPVAADKARVRWTCSCGQQLHDDFVENRAGAARELEAYLNRPRTHAGATPVSPSSSQGSTSFTGSSVGGPPSSQTSWSSYGLPSQDNSSNGGGMKPLQIPSGMTLPSPFQQIYEPPWLLTCANEDRSTPKVAHLDMAPHRIRSDKDLATSLREHYFNLNRRWGRSMRLRGLTTIEFVQFEVHQNRFADIRKCPDMPSPSLSDYNFQPGDLLPPVGSTYLLHLFRHPEDYDGELITYLRAPKKTGRLQLGVGWGISLVEGFEARKVWILVTVFFTFASLVFAIVWAWKKQDVQGAFGVAAYMTGLAALVVGWIHASIG